MQLPKGLRWPTTVPGAFAMQMAMRSQVFQQDKFGLISHVAGVDVGFEDGGKVARAGVAVLSFPDLVQVDFALAREPMRFPYVPGLLSFREVPVVIKALRRLKVHPDLILCDGHGYAHPRRFGIACHLGVLLDVPTIGIGKTRLVGQYDDPGTERGEWTPLRHQQELIGGVLRTRSGVRPIYVSVGHRVCLETALALTLACTRRFRIPETTRHAHKLASG